jgi:hypothetical protein
MKLAPSRATQSSTSSFRSAHFVAKLAPATLVNVPLSTVLSVKIEPINRRSAASATARIDSVVERP